jgi:hypothetical protein
MEGPGRIMEMKTELFAIKLPKKEKDAMNYTAQETGKTLTKVFYKAIQQTIYEQLGIVLLEKLSRPAIDKEEESEIARVPAYVRKNAANIVIDFVHLIEDKANKKDFHEIFENLQFAEKEYLLYEINSTELAYNLGKTYLDNDGGFEPPNLTLAKYLFFDYMIRQAYHLTAMGLLKTLDDEWTKNLPKIERFRDRMITQYEKTFEDAVEVVEVVEVVRDKNKALRDR